MSDIPCPIQQDTAVLQSLSFDMLRTMRRIRRQLLNCPSCPAFDNCPTLDKLNTTIKTAISEITEEWQLAADQIQN